jgi:hypothetical protein
MYPSKQAISSIPSRNYYSRGKIPEKARNKNLSSSNVGATMPEISQEMNPTQQNCHFLKHELELPRQRCLLIHHPTPPRTLLEWKVENQVSQDALPQYDDAIMVPGPEGTGRGGYQFGQRKLNRPGEETNTLGRRRRIPNRERRERERDHLLRMTMRRRRRRSPPACPRWQQQQRWRQAGRHFLLSSSRDPSVAGPLHRHFVPFATD